MKRFSIILLAIAVALVMGLPAGAKGPPDKPDKPGKPPETLIGMTCEEYGFATWDLYETGEPFTLTVTGREWACVDVVAPEGGDWIVDVVAAEGVRRVTIRVQDSVAPGDLCGDDMITGVLNTGDSLTLSEIPEATVNACGVEYDDEDQALAFLVFGQKGTFTIKVTPQVPPTS
jgi:hypothetical protein